MDRKGFYGLNTTYSIALEDWYLLAVLNSSVSNEYLRGTCAALGDEEEGGRLRFFGQYLETLPIPDAPSSERERVAGLAQQTQTLHTLRRQRVEEFLSKCGTSPARSSSRNLLEQPWAINAQEFTRRAPRVDPEVFRRAHEETAELTERILKIEREIDERVAALYGLDGTDAKPSK
jgi:hypothetical protein